MGESVLESVLEKIDFKVSDVDLGVGLNVGLLLSLELGLVDGDVHRGSAVEGIGVVELLDSGLGNFWGCEVGKTVWLLKVLVHGHDEGRDFTELGKDLSHLLLGLADVVVKKGNLFEVHVATSHESSLVSWLENHDLNDVFLELGVFAGLDTSLGLLLVLELDVSITERLAVVVSPEGSRDDDSELLQECLKFFLVDGGVNVLDEEVGFFVQSVSVEDDRHEVDHLESKLSILEVIEGSLGVLWGFEGNKSVVLSPLFQAIKWMRNVDDVKSVKMLINLFC